MHTNALSKFSYDYCRKSWELALWYFRSCTDIENLHVQVILEEPFKAFMLFIMLIVLKTCKSRVVLMKFRCQVVQTAWEEEFIHFWHEMKYPGITPYNYPCCDCFVNRTWGRESSILQWNSCCCDDIMECMFCFLYLQLYKLWFANSMDMLYLCMTFPLFLCF